ncbi:helix-turn-helix transcriptional regulator [Brevibacillus sp. AG]|uniref:helix-turn-helix transcriptional regulator n=1 Tax=Brevibacillus sp. AG TaxID=3020891 RepID=UPI00232D1EFE|nr:helix-turn-helix transcriptional regulator [Brevibacillus sp. AG]MDC0764853.1 helix-turn-helix transcriptional regulator [Brevibacillus sp. AG]
MTVKAKEYPTWELGGIIKKAEVIMYILSVIKADLPVTGMELVRHAKELNWSVSVTHVYKLLKSLEKHDPKKERFPILSSKWLDDGCRERLYYLLPLTGENFANHAISTMLERIDRVHQLIRSIERELSIDSSISPTPIPDSQELLSVRDLYRVCLLSHAQNGISIRDQIKIGAFGLHINKDHYRLQAEWLATNNYFASSTDSITSEGEGYLLDLKSQLIAQLPYAKLRIKDLKEYPTIYQRKRMVKSHP